VVIAVAVALKPPILLLDEPTSALDPESAKLAEAVLKACGSACVWVSHDPAQPGRVGGRVLELPAGDTLMTCLILLSCLRRPHDDRMKLILDPLLASAVLSMEHSMAISD